MWKSSIFVVSGKRIGSNLCSCPCFRFISVRDMGRQSEALECKVDDGSTSSSSSDNSPSSSSSDGRAVTPPPRSSQFEPEIRRTIFNAREVARIFVCIWSRKPAYEDLQHVNISRLKNADRSVWTSEKGRELTGEVPRFFRRIFIEELSSATTVKDIRIQGGL